MKRLLKEPLLHFALLGAALFGVYAWMRPAAAAGVEEITVSAGQVEALAIGFARTWQRPPTPAELEGLVDDHVEEVVLGREAIALGLDRDDAVIRRRLRQKMEFVTEDLALTAEPSEAELREFLQAHPEEFLQDARTSFRHVFLSEDRGAGLAADAAELLAGLRAAGPGADTMLLGDRLWIPGEFTLATHQVVAGQLGEDFAAALDEVAPGAWSGPLRSAYGRHLVLVTERRGGRLPALDEIRAAVRREVLAARRERMERELVDGLLRKYRVSVEWPSDGDVASAAASAASAIR